MSEDRTMVERPPLDEDRRLAYLEAMGVSVWERRASSVAMPEAVGVMPAPVERNASVESIEPESPAMSAPTLDERASSQPVATVESTPVAEHRSVVGAASAAFSVDAAEAAPTKEVPRAVSDLEPLSFPDWDEAADYSPALLDEWDAMGHPPATEVEAVNPVERMDWNTLDATVRGCRACRLWETRTKTVFGTGDRRADLMIIGEAPGADEDSQGEPFVGRAGQLLTLMLAAIGFSREQVYIANVLKCRPPGNRDPKPDEALACQSYLHRQVALIEPRVILSVGRISAQHLLKTETPVGQLRGRWFDYGPARIPLRVTYHPAYLLRSPEQKAKAWEDLTEVKRRL
jgi:uracil-DNA glycosylase